MQLICRFDTKDWDAWKVRFDEQSENRAQAGLTLLQLWRDADTHEAAVALFEVADRERAETWLEREAGFGQALTSDFVKRA
jgi:hypothetical protein